MTQLSHLEVCLHAFLLALLQTAFTAQAVGLPDTGQTTCYDDNSSDAVSASDPASIARDAGTHPRQDCRYGRDAAAAADLLTKTGAGVKGFDYTKIANDGSALAADATLGSNAGDWACTRDNITGLIWEVKTTSGLRNMALSYTWYSTNAATNGGDAGAISDTASCLATLANCNTEAYVTAVNAGNGMCNASDWRLPTQRELLTLVIADDSGLSIDPTYFPNTPDTGGAPFWSATSDASYPPNVRTVIFPSGYGTGANKQGGNYVRLVSGGPF